MGLRGVRRCGGAARGDGVYLLAETGGRPVVWGWPPMPEDGRPKKGRMCMSAVEKIERQQAKEKGINESLVLVDSLAFIVNVPSRTVVTAMDQTETKSNVFTNIDGAVIM